MSVNRARRNPGLRLGRRADAQSDLRSWTSPERQGAGAIGLWVYRSRSGDGMGPDGLVDAADGCRSWLWVVRSKPAVQVETDPGLPTRIRQAGIGRYGRCGDGQHGSSPGGARMEAGRAVLMRVPPHTGHFRDACSNRSRSEGSSLGRLQTPTKVLARSRSPPARTEP